MEPSQELELLEELDDSIKYDGRLGIFYQIDDDRYKYKPIGSEVDRELGTKPSKKRISEVCEKYCFSKVIFIDHV